MEKIKEFLPSPEQIITALQNFKLAGNEVLILILVILLLSLLIDFLLSNSILGKSYRIFVGPGVILHELSHALFCLLTGARIKSMSLFDREGGRVEHEESKLPLIGPILISISPFFIGMIAIYFLSQKLGLSSINIFTLDTDSPGTVIEIMKGVLTGIDISSIKNWVIVYLVLSIAVTMAPSWQDLRNSFSSLVIFGLAIYGLQRFGVINWNEQFFQNERVVILLSSITLLLILGGILSMIVYVLSRFIKKP